MGRHSNLTRTAAQEVHMKTIIEMKPQKKIALVAHDGRKPDLLAWVTFNKATLTHHVLYATGTTGALLNAETGLPVTRLKSGPLGGDQQIGAKISEGEIDFLIFFWDPLEPQPHDPDVKALLRLAVLYNIPTASNRATADFLISSPFFEETYERLIPDYAGILVRLLEDDDDEQPD
jgi:methylglyoxal synthase